MKYFMLLFVLFPVSITLIGQTYTEISIDTSEHVEIEMIPGETYYYQTLSVSSGQYSTAIIGFIDSSEAAIDFLDIEIENVFLTAIIGSRIVWSIQFKMSLKDDAPASGVLEDVSMVSVFLNGSGNVIGGIIRNNMTLSWDSMIATSTLEGTAFNVKVYPNPSLGFVHIESLNEEELGKVSILNAAGQVLLEENIARTKHVLDLQTLPTGHYWIKIQNLLRQQTSALFVK